MHSMCLAALQLFAWIGHSRGAEAENIADALARPTASKDAIIWRADRVCGLNCLYLLLRCADRHPNYVQMEATLAARKVTTLYDIQQSAKEYGVELAVARLAPDDLKQVPKPVIIHLDVADLNGTVGGHFVLVTRVLTQGVEIVDGTTAETRVLSWSQLHKSWSGFCAYCSDAMPPTWPIVALAVGCVCGVLLICRFDPRRTRSAMFRRHDTIVATKP
jgi:hypothetical protein